MGEGEEGERERERERIRERERERQRVRAREIYNAVSLKCDGFQSFGEVGGVTWILLPPYHSHTEESGYHVTTKMSVGNI